MHSAPHFHSRDLIAETWTSISGFLKVFGFLFLALDGEIKRSDIIKARSLDRKEGMVSVALYSCWQNQNALCGCKGTMEEICEWVFDSLYANWEINGEASGVVFSSWCQFCADLTWVSGFCFVQTAFSGKLGSIWIDIKTFNYYHPKSYVPPPPPSFLRKRPHRTSHDRQTKALKSSSLFSNIQ